MKAIDGVNNDSEQGGRLKEDLQLLMLGRLDGCRWRRSIKAGIDGQPKQKIEAANSSRKRPMIAWLEKARYVCQQVNATDGKATNEGISMMRKAQMKEEGHTDGSCGLVVSMKKTKLSVGGGSNWATVFWLKDDENVQIQRLRSIKR